MKVVYQLVNSSIEKLEVAEGTCPSCGSAIKTALVKPSAVTGAIDDLSRPKISCPNCGILLMIHP